MGLSLSYPLCIFYTSSRGTFLSTSIGNSQILAQTEQQLFRCAAVDSVAIFVAVVRNRFDKKKSYKTYKNKRYEQTSTLAHTNKNSAPAGTKVADRSLGIMPFSLNYP